MRTPDRTETESRVGYIPCTYSVWIDEAEGTWADWVDDSPDACGPVPPSGTHAVDVYIEATIDVLWSEKHVNRCISPRSFQFKGRGSLGCTVLDRSAASDRYLEDTIREILEEAYEDLACEVNGIASGSGVTRAKVEQAAARSVRWSES